MSALMMEASKLTNSHQGWVVLRADMPEEAVFGMIAFRRLGPDGTLVTGPPIPGEKEESMMLEWMPYGKRLEPNIVLAQSFAQFRTMVNDMRPRGIFRCDDPEQRLVGFVGYDGAKGKSTVVRLPVTRIKDADIPENDEFNMEIVIGSSVNMRY